MPDNRIFVLEPHPSTRPEGARYLQFELAIDDDGWPPADWEAVWAQPDEAFFTYRVVSIPAFVFDIAVGDLVQGKLGPDDDLQFDHKISSGGHSTIRVYMHHELPDSTIAEVRAGVTASGCTYQLTSWDAILAVDIPTEKAYERLYSDVLIPQADAGHLTVEKGCWTFD
ncbi:DUF4265 domain-containing protein [Mycolicibacterium sp. 120266]|uniref:DUF4265 domain-containing protein n=1 Tax=Mycolicibacterium sp. 120266 TaxID=3090601 RepID=UPI00299D7F88|nr:DUF4265 domain-containing protein [Mycolicibacterium sp. 120266]MDX1870587.1 DUF4265 domain-containing protein [Mycolicibacterium sp. 120266]